MSLRDLVAEIRQATDYQNNRRLLREQVQQDLLVTHGDGLFRASPELICFLEIWSSEDEVYLEDVYENPICCNRAELLERCREQYQKVMNRWHVRHEELRKIRKI